jgi:hypothetical protein
MPRILDTRSAVAAEIEHGKPVRFMTIMEAVVTIEKRQNEYAVTFMLAPVHTRQLLIIHEHTFPTVDSIVAAFGIDETEEIFAVLRYNQREQTK